MQFQQSQLTHSTQFTLREHGIFVSQRDGRGQVNLSVEIPYEEVLPVRLEYRNTMPAKALSLASFGLLYLAVHLARPWLAAGPQPPWPDETWLSLLGLSAALVGWFAYAWNNWWHQAILHTAHLQLVLADHPRDRRQFRAFTEKLDAHTKTYLRQEYGAINPLGYIEPQVRRVAWLRDLGVLSVPEAKALTTRLTGRLSERELRSMGQRLEAPYVN